MSPSALSKAFEFEDLSTNIAAHGENTTMLDELVMRFQ
jgi:hypothetical protein